MTAYRVARRWVRRRMAQATRSQPIEAAFAPLREKRERLRRLAARWDVALRLESDRVAWIAHPSIPADRYPPAAADVSRRWRGRRAPTRATPAADRLEGRLDDGPGESRQSPDPRVHEIVNASGRLVGFGVLQVGRRPAAPSRSRSSSTRTSGSTGREPEERGTGCRSPRFWAVRWPSTATTGAR